MDKTSKSSKVKNILIIVGAWATVPALGVGTLFFSLLMGGVVVGENTEELLTARFIIIAGVSGLISLIAPILITFKLRKRVFFKHLLAGLLIGYALYLLIILSGAGWFISINSKKADDLANTCTNIGNQLSIAQESTIPIATDNGTGTGFAVQDGHTIITAYHVIDGAKSVNVNFMNDVRPLTVVAVAPEYDLAMLSVEKPVSKFMNFTKKYSVADSLYSLGYPGNAFNTGQASLASGVLSRVLSNEDIKLNTDNAPTGLEIIQSDMALNPGNSGGPIFNKCGVVGVVSTKSNTQQLAGISSEEGISYGISSKTAAGRFKLPLND